MKKGTILIVDDSPTNLHMLVNRLESSGFTVLVASNGEQALQQLKSLTPDMILLDILMPGIDGFETCRRLKDQKKTRDIPVIFMTALSNVEDRIKGFEAGGIDYLTKPLHSQEVIVRVTTHLENQKLHEQLKAQNLCLERQNTLLEDKNTHLQREIAERKRTEEILKETLEQIELVKQEWESTADSLSHLILLLDSQGRIIRANRTVEYWELGNVSKIKGKSVHHLLHPDCTDPACYLTTFFSRAWETLPQHQASEYEMEDHLLQRYLNLQIRPISSTSEKAVSTSSAVCIIHDITDRKHVEQALTQRTQELLLLNQLSDALQRCQREEDTYNELVAICRQLFPDSSGSFCMMELDQNTLREVAFWGNPPDEIRKFGVDDSWIFDHDQTSIIQHPDTQGLSTYIGYSPDSKYLCIPVSASDEILAILSIDFTCCYRNHNEIERLDLLKSSRPILTGVVEHYAISLLNLRLRERLRKESILDSLTNLYNRRHMEISLNREARRAQRHNTPLGVMMLDVDHFKHFNDTYGHEVGDIVLRELGGLLQRHTRAEDIACRYGGEEFLLILPEASLEDTMQRAEELRIMAKELQIRYHDKNLHITISLGVAALPQHGFLAKDIIHAADTALYQAKNRGRDRVELASR